MLSGEFVRIFFISLTLIQIPGWATKPSMCWPLVNRRCTGRCWPPRPPGHTHVLLDGTLIRTDRSRATSPTAGVDLWWSGKHRHHGGNIQVVSASDGRPLWTSQVRPGREHDTTTAARIDPTCSPSSSPGSTTASSAWPTWATRAHGDGAGPAQLGAGRARRGRAAIAWLYVVWIRPSSAIDLSSPSTVTLSRVASRCTSRCDRNGCSVCSKSVCTGKAAGSRSSAPAAVGRAWSQRGHRRRRHTRPRARAEGEHRISPLGAPGLEPGVGLDRRPTAYKAARHH
jgi:DDE superfamily endonuclease